MNRLILEHCPLGHPEPPPFKCRDWYNRTKGVTLQLVVMTEFKDSLLKPLRRGQEETIGLEKEFPAIDLTLMMDLRKRIRIPRRYQLSKRKSRLG